MAARRRSAGCRSSTCCASGTSGCRSTPVLAVDRDSPLYNERDKAGVFYAESWALLHYLLLGRERGAREAGRPVRREVDRPVVAPDQARQQALEVPLAQLEKACARI